MKSCGTRQADLKAYLDGELPLLERPAMWWHLDHCAKCREAKTAMTEITRRVGDIDGDMLPAALRARILSSVSYSDNLAAGPVPGPVRKHRVRPPLLLVGGATAAALFAVILMRPILFPGLTPKAAAPRPDEKPTSATVASPSMPSTSPEPQQSLGGGGQATATFDRPAAVAPAPSKLYQEKDAGAAPASPPAAFSAPKSIANQASKPVSDDAEGATKSAAGPAQSERERAAHQPSDSVILDPNRREADSMNMYSGDQTDKTKQEFNKLSDTSSQSALKKELKSSSAARKAKARAKAQAQRNSRTQPSQPSQSRSGSSAK